MSNFDITNALDPSLLSFDATLTSVQSNKSMKIENGKITNVEQIWIEVGFTATIKHVRGFYLILPMKLTHNYSIPVIGFKGISLKGAKYEVVETSEEPVIYFSKEKLAESYVLLSLGSAETTLDESEDRFELRFKADIGHQLYHDLRERISASSSDKNSFTDDKFENLGMIIGDALEALTEPSLDANPSSSKTVKQQSDENIVLSSSTKPETKKNADRANFKQPSGVNNINNLDKNSRNYSPPVPNRKDEMLNVEGVLGN